MVYEWIENNLYPPRCTLCDAPGDGLDLCRGCRGDLPFLIDACAVCALALAADAPARCPNCLRRPPPFDSAVSVLRYEPPVDWLITQLKFHRRLSHARILGALLAERLLQSRSDGCWPDALLPVPLHRTRWAERGFNQAAEIARVLSRRLAIPMTPRIATRSRPTPHQIDLPAARRRANVRGAFTVATTVAGAKIAVVDDVVTTGHTVAELARCLRRAGAAHIAVWSAARA